MLKCIGFVVSNIDLMKTLQRYDDVLLENITELSSNTDIVEIATTFVENVQDENVEIEKTSFNHFDANFEYSGFKYKIRCAIENEEIGITGIYRSGNSEDEEVNINMSKLDFLRCLNTRNLYNATVDKLVRCTNNNTL